jgi:hypothetical protein
MTMNDLPAPPGPWATPPGSPPPPPPAPPPTVLPPDGGAVAEPRDRLFSWRAVGRYFTPPAPWATPPASLEELASYAHVGEWAPSRGIRRGLGIAYWYCWGLPITVGCRYVEWFAQRPGRVFTLLFTSAVLYHTPPGHWVAHALGRIFTILSYPLTWLY